MVVSEIEHSAKLLEWAMKSAGKEGPLWFDCGVIYHNGIISKEFEGTSDIFQIGKEGEIIELDDILSTLREAANHEVINEWYGGSRTFYHSGYRVSRDGKTIKMIWSS